MNFFSKVRPKVRHHCSSHHSFLPSSTKTWVLTHLSQIISMALTVLSVVNALAISSDAVPTSVTSNGTESTAVSGLAPLKTGVTECPSPNLLKALSPDSEVWIAECASFSYNINDCKNLGFVYYCLGGDVNAVNVYPPAPPYPNQCLCMIRGGIC